MRMRTLGHLCSEARIGTVTDKSNSDDAPIDTVPSDVIVSQISHDSRDVSPGAVFCAVRGARFDGHEHVGEALRRGAVALVVDHRLTEIDPSVPQIVVGDVRTAMGRLATAFWGDPSRQMDVVGVTGTNGKTTTTHLLAAILTAAGRPTDVIGTLSGGFTTPEAPELQSTLAEMRERGTRAVAMEVSSHSLVMERVTGTRFAAAVFTNLSRDHLDLHGNMEEYFAAKARLFDPSFTDIAVVNADDTYGRRLLDAPRVRTIPFSKTDLDDIQVTTIEHRFVWRGRSVRCPLGGAVNVMNSLAAATVADALGVDGSTIAEALAEVAPVPGRMERIDEGQDFTVLVDYAHTPDGLSAVLRSLRESSLEGKILVVFGCGGDRDKAKRPMMGEAAAGLADEVIVTSDNPRSEDPQAIIASIVAGVPDHLRHRLVGVITDRRAAIESAIDRARPGDVVLIAGKGHETTQTTGTNIIDFDDREIARELLGVRA
ncbi:MAG: UDP-N-acetylmuramoyl-L-alanyl-D-glutamate--2,6-diaminopimelate ligase [Actinomycetota bacterium]|jgi:UDP-N-acetylmuramoyl-L-alanyl-D-glutamate--2,6-diaminopimelate ligase|nr:UDP-N-acetylmuramoyl-L-alanyl-D-glutamate--2,6-diaminopimelate ligase [Actinomycetota bacterium]MDA3011380.1 UDP-N-acetylmuramoyl-L-alanyl-D-glutamate--2,6-diaminopimelate ligase [Actinomycetota bacterium]MDA3024244.1 UDP-N-acetylmuramoyl-L-alanyl-D-glutamate--2,6-diaminopimelate ligase [Actinomycetota bacterium]